MTIGATTSSLTEQQNLISQIYLHSNFPVREVDLNRLVELTKDPSTETLIESARILQEEVPIRIARRIVALEGLPSTMLSHPSIEKLKAKLIQTFAKLKDAPPVVDQASEREYMILQQGVRDEHADMYNLLVDALIHSGENAENGTVTDIIDSFYSSRIGLRMLMDHHNAIKRQISSGSQLLGIIDNTLNPCEAIEDMIPDVRSCCESNFGLAPNIVLDGSHTEFQFSYVRDHVERIMYAILLNASRATAQHHLSTGVEENDDIAIPDVRVFVAGDEAGCTIRVNDEGGRLVSWNNVDTLFKYSSTLSHSCTENGTDPLTASAIDFGARTVDNTYVVPASASVRRFTLFLSLYF
jgi:[3-methyl-2-oxobutanoate dehydrogenase (acetyl-transferring)] kinase